MKFQVSSTSLRDALNAAARIIPSKTPMPILENILLEITDPTTLKVTSSDGDTTLYQHVAISADSDVQLPFALCVPAKTFDPLNTIPEQQITLAADNNEMMVQYQSGQFNFMGVNAREYPVMQQLNEEALDAVNIASTSVLAGISRTLYATADDQLRPTMSAVLFDFQNDALVCVATDSKKLIKVTMDGAWKGNPVKRQVVIPKRMATILKQTMTKECGDCILRWDGARIEMQFGSSVLAVKGIEGRFPPYERVIPQNNTLEAVFDSKSLQTTLKRMNSFANASTGQVVLSFSNDMCEIKSQDVDFGRKAKEVVKCAYSASPIDISFRAPILIEMLNNLPQGDISFLMDNPSKPALLVPTAGDERILALIMPMLIS